MSKKALPKIVSEKTFRGAIEKFRKREKKNTRERDQVSALRRRLPMMEVNCDYSFDGAKGSRSFLDLFEKRKQLIVYHFMYHPKTDTFCKGCSMVGDQLPHLSHVNARETSFVMISNAPLKSILRHKKRMGWDIPWYSSWGTNFNKDLKIDGNSEPVMSVFLRDGKRVFRTYYTTQRGLEYIGTPWALLDLTPFGRQEKWEKSPKGWPQTEMYSWWRLHDEY